MIKFILPAHLFQLLREDAPLARSSPRTVLLDPGSWPEIVSEIRERFPRLATRVLTESGSLATGFALVVNDEVVQGDPAALRVHSGHQMSIIAAMAGG
jgi:hypothetical protein